jgi:hypothetical protein
MNSNLYRTDDLTVLGQVINQYYLFLATNEYNLRVWSTLIFITDEHIPYISIYSAKLQTYYSNLRHNRDYLLSFRGNFLPIKSYNYLLRAEEVYSENLTLVKNMTYSCFTVCIWYICMCCSVMSMLLYYV